MLSAPIKLVIVRVRSSEGTTKGCEVGFCDVNPPNELPISECFRAVAGKSDCNQDAVIGTTATEAATTNKGASPATQVVVNEYRGIFEFGWNS